MLGRSNNGYIQRKEKQVDSLNPFRKRNQQQKNQSNKNSSTNYNMRVIYKDQIILIGLFIFVLTYGGTISIIQMRIIGRKKQ